MFWNLYSNYFINIESIIEIYRRPKFHSKFLNTYRPEYNNPMHTLAQGVVHYLKVNKVAYSTQYIHINIFNIFLKIIHKLYTPARARQQQDNLNV